jgi:hypothetical protein
MTTEKSVWFVERAIDGRPHWLAWRNRSAIAWVTDATQADQFDWEIAASREARLITETQGVECRATEHLFLQPRCQDCDALLADLAECHRKFAIYEASDAQANKERERLEADLAACVAALTDAHMTMHRPHGQCADGCHVAAALARVQKEEGRI